jgi:metallophosphoesterase (TIGR03767 family)
MDISRRAFLRRASALAASGILAPEVLRANERAWAVTQKTAASPAGTTLESTLLLPAGTGYRHLTVGPGWPTKVRTLGAAAQAGREGRRVALASIVHLTDIHIVDTQSPARVEFLDRYADPPSPNTLDAAQRAQETLTVHVAESMVQRINRLARGPITGRRFDCAVSTGDNGDNRQQNEMEWFITLLDGGPVTPNSGGPDYEGVQDQDTTTYDAHYWHPEDTRPDGDFYKKLHGYPAYPGLLAAAIKPLTASGLTIPWYTIYGNHDGLVQGNAPSNAVLEAIATGPLKVVDLPAGLSPGDLNTGLQNSDPTILAALASAPARPVTADAKRHQVSPREWAALHLASPATPGPVGHGLPASAATTGLLYYVFDVAPGVRGISLDTVDRGGMDTGSLDAAQFAWLEARLTEVSSRSYDASGAVVRSSAPDHLIVLFSHHNLDTLGNQTPDPGNPGPRVLGPAIEALLHRFPNVVAWVNGHSHKNKVVPHPDPANRSGGFWEVLTSAHIDYPEEARIVELVDNRDGTLSIFGTLVEHLAPPSVTIGATGLLDLAALSRELAANDYQPDQVDALGTDDDRNVELVVAAPFNVAGALSPAATTTPATQSPRTTPSTGGRTSVAATVGAAALAGAIALRARGRRVAAPARDL